MGYILIIAYVDMFTIYLHSQFHVRTSSGHYTTKLGDNAGTNFFSSPKVPDPFWAPPSHQFESAALGALSLVVTWLGHKADQSPLSIAKVKMYAGIPSFPHMSS